MRDILFKLMAALVFISGLGQLAMSQVHILASTKVFASEVGIYLFAFIIFGLVTAFNTFSLKSWKGIAFFILTNWITATCGFIYVRLLNADVVAQKTLTIADVYSSWILVVIAISLHLISSLVIPALSFGRVGEKKI